MQTKLGKEIRRLRRKHDMTLEDVAKYLGLKSVSNVSDVENGNKRREFLSRSRLAQLEDLFGVKRGHLIRIARVEWNKLRNPYNS